MMIKGNSHIIIDITEEMRRRSRQFARRKEATTYRYTNEEDKVETIYRGKLGEEVALKALDRLRIPYDDCGRLTVVDSKEYADAGDCILFPHSLRRVVDIKTTVSDRAIPLFEEEINGKRKIHYIVGVRLAKERGNYVYGEALGFLTMEGIEEAMRSTLKTKEIRGSKAYLLPIRHYFKPLRQLSSVDSVKSSVERGEVNNGG